MKPLHCLLPALVLGATALLAAPDSATGSAPLVRLVPDNAFFVASIADVPAFSQSLANSPWYHGLADPMWDKSFGEIRREFTFLKDLDAKVKTITGASLPELLECATGDAVLFVPDSEIPLPSSSDAAVGKALSNEFNSPRVIVAFRTGDKAGRLAAILDAARKEGEKTGNLKTSTSQTGSVTLHTVTFVDKDADADTTREIPSVSYAISNGVFLASGHLPSLQAVLGQLDAGGFDKNITTRPDYAAIAAGTPGAGFVAFLNWQAVYTRINAAVAALGASGQDPAAGMLGVPATHLLNALGLDAVRHVGLAAAIGKEATRIDSVLAFSEQRGLLSLLAWEDGPVTLPDWAPASFYQASTGNFNFPRAWAALEELVASLHPMVHGMAQGYIGQLNQAAGIDLKKDLIGSLGTRYLSGIARPAAGTTASLENANQLYALSLADPAAFTRAIEALKKTVLASFSSQLTRREFAGVTVSSLALPGAGGVTAPRGVHYAITGDWLLINVGDAAPLEASLTAIAAGKDAAGAADPFWKRPAIAAAVAKAPPASFDISVTELPPYLLAIANTAVSFLNEKASANATSADEAAAAPGGATDDPENATAPKPAKKRVHIDPATLPTLEQLARFWGIVSAFSQREKDGFHGHVVIEHP
ncbi:hypothetical protein OPIT5_27760 [Opitutaceae bacterium TAV5]|nr:hypothetical protein OPIT5_27760 [Opitutaceae bacterium TAV5]